MDKKKDIVSTQELADILGISRIAVFKKIQKGQIKAEKIGRNYVIYRKDIDAVIDGELSDSLKKKIDKGVIKVVREYGETLKMLGQE